MCDLDCVIDQRDAKRHKTGRDYSGSFLAEFGLLKLIFFPSPPVFLQGVQVLMRSITPLDYDASLRTRPVLHLSCPSTYLQLQQWQSAMNSKLQHPSSE